MKIKALRLGSLISRVYLPADSTFPGTPSDWSIQSIRTSLPLERKFTSPLLVYALTRLGRNSQSSAGPNTFETHVSCIHTFEWTLQRSGVRSFSLSRHVTVAEHEISTRVQWRGSRYTGSILDQDSLLKLRLYRVDVEPLMHIAAVDLSGSV